ncbi:MAG: acyl-CoA/acyl-ACP dehydrogenase [Candidatus Lambdaproteobacteria bacterium]|nr:acyl-CoA/acyl-ACP dehydrogenase [Candidatus Lambdaproteobacteria bacterium]
MDLQFSEEQRAMQAQAREFMEQHCPLERVRALWDTPDGCDDALWGGMAELGWMGMLLPEEFGGLGLGVTDLSRVLEELGRGLLPGPFLAHLLGTQAVLLAGTPAQRAEWLPRLAGGEQRVALVAHGEGGRTDAQGGNVRARASGKAHVLEGGKLAVPGAAQARTLVVAAAGKGGLAFYLVDAAAPGVEIRPLRAIEQGVKLAGVSFNMVKVPPGQRLAGASGDEAAAQVSALCDVALAFDALGGAERAMHMAVEYAKLRQAFGQPIGSFQAIKHKAADMLYAVESLRAIALWAAWVLDVPAAARAVPARVAAAMARCTAIETYDLVVRHATQVQGAIATTEEHQMHMFAKRSRLLALSYAPLAWYQELVLQANGFPELAS